MPVNLYVKDTTTLLGTVSDEQWKTLVELLEEEDTRDKDYYVDRDILDYLEEEGADAGLLALLRPHVTDDDGIEVEGRPS